MLQCLSDTDNVFVDFLLGGKRSFPKGTYKESNKTSNSMQSRRD